MLLHWLGVWKALITFAPLNREQGKPNPFPVLSKNGKPKDSYRKDFDSLGIGIQNRSNARILLTTHQMVAARSSKGDFTVTPDLFYKGSRRPLIIWDESYIQSEQVSLAVNKIYKLIDEFNGYHRGFANALAEFGSGLTVEAVGQRVIVGDDIRQFIVMLAGR